MDIPQTGRPHSMIIIGWQYGLAIAFVTSMISLISHFLHLNELTEFSNVMVRNSFISTAFIWGAIVIGLIMGLKKYRDGDSGLMTLGEGLTLSIYIGLFSGLFMMIYHWLYATYLLPGVLEELGGLVGFEDIDKDDGIHEAINFFTSPAFVAITGFINRILSCAVFGFFVSLIIRKE